MIGMVRESACLDNDNRNSYFCLYESIKSLTKVNLTGKNSKMSVCIILYVRLVAFGKRSYVEWRRNNIASGSIAIKDFHDNLFGSISFHFVLEHCLAWVTALAVLCSSSNILTSLLHVSFSLWIQFGEYLGACATQPSLIGLSDAYDVFDL